MIDLNQKFFDQLAASNRDAFTEYDFELRLARFRSIFDREDFVPSCVEHRDDGFVYLVPPKQFVVQDVIPLKKQDAPAVKSSCALVPEVDPYFVKPAIYDDLLLVLQSKQYYPVYIQGETGVGKSYVVEQVCADAGRSLIRINLVGETREDSLIGSKTLIDGNINWVDGPVLIAMKQGDVLLLDEIDAAHPNAIMCLQGILEGKGYYNKYTNEIVKAAPGFTVFATANTLGRGSESGRYIGTNIQNTAFLERFAATFLVDLPTLDEEKKIIASIGKKYGVNDKKLLSLVTKFSATVRQTYAEGGIDEIISIRRIEKILQSFAIFGDLQKAVKLAIARFDPATRDAMTTLFAALTPEDAPQEPVHPSV